MYIRCLDSIPECVVAQFHEAAEREGATSAVAAALAYIAGAKDIVSRSLLSAHQDNRVYYGWYVEVDFASIWGGGWF